MKLLLSFLRLFIDEQCFRQIVHVMSPSGM